MRISQLRREHAEGMAQIAADVVWEDCPQPARTVHVRVPEAFEEDLQCSASAMLLGAAIPALHFGERRIAIDGSICPLVRNGLQTVGWFLRTWYGPPRPDLCLEPSGGFVAPLPPPRQRVASFLSGGVDSLATVRSNRLDYPPDHPGSIRDCLTVDGFDLGHTDQGPPGLDTFEHAIARLAVVARDASLRVVPVYTNIRHLAPDVDFWCYQFHGAALAAVAHALGGRVSDVLIASTSPCDVVHNEFWGSHPLLDPHYSSAALRVHHDGLRFSRLNKLRLVADWQVGLDNLRVCTSLAVPDGLLNCGQCEKCTRTMLYLLLLGKLGGCRAFPATDVDPQVADRVISIRHHWQAKYYEPIVDLLDRAGRPDLASIIRAKCDRFRHPPAPPRDWKEPIRRFDRAWLGGGLGRLRGRLGSWRGRNDPSAT